MAEKTYICIRKCYFGKGKAVNGAAPPRRVYSKGDFETFDPEDKDQHIPRHFVLYKLVPDIVGDIGTGGFGVKAGQKEKPILKGVKAPIDPEKLAALKEAEKK